MIKKTFSLVFLMMLICGSMCWWELGHILVAQVAKDRLIELNKTNSLNRMTELITAFSNLTDGRTNTFI